MQRSCHHGTAFFAGRARIRCASGVTAAQVCHTSSPRGTVWASRHSMLYNLRGTWVAPVACMSAMPVETESILLVEDDLSLQASLRDLLRDSGYQTHIAATRSDGLVLLRRFRPAVRNVLRHRGWQQQRLLKNARDMSPEA